MKYHTETIRGALSVTTDRLMTDHMNTMAEDGWTLFGTDFTQSGGIMVIMEKDDDTAKPAGFAP